MTKDLIKKAFLISFSFIFVPKIGFAAADTPISVAIQGPTKHQSVEAVIAAVLQWVVNIGAIVVTLAFIYTGFQFVAARGNPEGIKKAKESFLWTVVGTIVLLGAQVLAEVIKNTVGTS
jgi:NADH:ubiquinone oxidoreductase subunit 6 (subunit J)